MGLLNVIRVILRILLANRAALVAENLAVRQQLAVLNRSAKRPRLRRRDRIFWVWISRLWRGWRSASQGHPPLRRSNLRDVRPVLGGHMAAAFAILWGISGSDGDIGVCRGKTLDLDSPHASCASPQRRLVGGRPV